MIALSFSKTPPRTDLASMLCPTVQHRGADRILEARTLVTSATHITSFTHENTTTLCVEGCQSDRQKQTRLQGELRERACQWSDRGPLRSARNGRRDQDDGARRAVSTRRIPRSDPVQYAAIGQCQPARPAKPSTRGRPKTVRWACASPISCQRHKRRQV